MRNLGKIQSEKARKEIEQQYGLVKAEDSKQRQAYQLKPVNVQKVQYGRSETKRVITNVLDAVVNYKYTSLLKLNAVLQQYNNLPMIVLSYPQHITVAVEFDKPIGHPLVYKGNNYWICEPTPQKKDLRIGQSLPSCERLLLM